MQTGTARGVTAMFVAVAAFSLMDALLKAFSTQYPAMQVTAMRAAASLPFVLLPLLVRGRLAELRPTRPWMHLLRGALGVVMLSTFIFALRGNSLSSVYSIYMAAPLLIVALAALLMGERVDAGRWLAVLVGLAGVLVILRPSTQSLALAGGLAAAVSALCYAIGALLARMLTRTDSSASMVFSFLLIMTLVSATLAAPDWLPIRNEHWLWLAGVGAFGAAGQHYLTEAFRLAPTSTVAPIEYTALLWGMGLDWIVWATLPQARMLAGAGLVIAAGLYVVHRERTQVGKGLPPA